ncbi:family 16 glycosylhydrolase [Fibrobacterota bacterium]
MSRITILIVLSILATTITHLFAEPPAPPAGKMWVQVDKHSDEFNGTSLDGNKWMNYHPYWNGREPSQYNKQNVSVGNGNLLLKSTVANANQQGNWVYSACVTSKNRDCNVGYYETRIKGSRISMTSAFWFQGKYTEIDVIENIGASTANSDLDWLMRMNTHYYPNGWNNDIKTPEQFRMPTKSCEEYHVYGVWWRNETSIWMYHNDDKVVEIKPGGAFDEPQYMFFDTETFTWDGLPTLASLNDPNKNTMLVDWVRAWILEDGTPIVTNQDPLHTLVGLSGDVTVEVCDIRGRVIKTVRINSPENIKAVTKELRRQRSGLSAGLYLYRFISDNRTIINKKVELF